MHSTTSVQKTHHQSALDGAIAEAVLALSRVVQVRLPAAAGFADRERAALDVANEVCRRFFASELQRIADSHPDEVFIDGRNFRRHERGTVAYHTLCGDVLVERCTYRLAGVHNGPTVVPLELTAGLIEGATPTLAYSVAEGMAEMPSRRYEQVMHAARRRIPSRSTVERLAKALGNEIKRDVTMLEGFVRAHETLPEGAHAISIGLDRTTVPMAEERPESQPPSSRRRPRTTPRIRRAPAPIDVCYRMVYVGTVSAVNRDGDALVTRKYAATPEEGPDELLARMAADVRRMRLRRRLPVVVVQDGAPELWNLIWDVLVPAKVRRDEVTLVLDRFHVTERIATVLEEIERDPDKRTALFDKWRRRLDVSNQAVTRFAEWMIKVTSDRPKLQQRLLLAHHGYLFSYGLLGYTRYRTCRAKGFPTASGVTEGACKSLIAARFKRSGQRWQQDGLTAILTLRAICQSDRMRSIWPLFERRYQRPVVAAN